MFFIGQKITLKDPNINWNPRGYVDLTGIILPKFGVVYTVRELVDMTIFPCLRLNEIKNTPNKHGIEITFMREVFRPVIEKKTDISVFQEILLTTKAPETVS